MKEKLRKLFPISLKDALILLIAMGTASLLCEFLRAVTTSDVHVPLIFVLVTLIVSFSTSGYFFGLLAAVVSVFAVNWAFTYPYGRLDFSIYGYPLTFVTMLAVGIVASTLATRSKEGQNLRIDNAKEKMRSNLLRSLSHDLRTPLTAIGGNISAVIEGEDILTKDEKHELLKNAKDDVDWLYTMVENLLSVTKISGDAKTELKKSDELIEEIFSETVLKFKRNNCDIKVEISCPEEALFVSVDAMLIEQVLLNLMDNAVKHGQTTTQIRLSARERDNMAVIRVEDNGKGISPELFENIFTLSGEEMIMGSDSSRFMGIGLMVCKTIVSAHGGTIEAKNLPSGGAVFEFTLPTAGDIYGN